MNRLLIGSTAILFGMCAALGWALYGQIQTNGKLRAELATAANELKAERLAAKLDRQEAVGNYERASDACQNAIRSAVEAVQLKPIEVPRYDESGNPSPTCPAVRLRDITEAGSGPFVPSSSDGESKARADTP